MSTGEAAAKGKEGHLNASPHQNYVDGITESAKAALAQQARPMAGLPIS